MIVPMYHFRFILIFTESHRDWLSWQPPPGSPIVSQTGGGPTRLSRGWTSRGTGDGHAPADVWSICRAAQVGSNKRLYPMKGTGPASQTV